MQNDIRNALDDHSHPISPRMSLKCAYYLTDCREVGCGNTWIVPGSVDTDLANGATLFPEDHSGPLGQRELVQFELLESHRDRPDHDVKMIWPF